MKKTPKKIKMNYEPEADVLRIEINKGKIIDSLEFGNFIFHLNKNNKPVFMEILDARNFLLASSGKILEKEHTFELVNK